MTLQTLSLQSNAQEIDSESYEIQKRIFGGIVVDLDASGNAFENGWSAVGALLDNYQRQFCGASLIASKWLLTAAHCLYNQNGTVDKSLKMAVVFNQQNPNFILLNQTLSRRIVNSIIHPDYNYSSDNHDLALLELDEAVTSIIPIKLPGNFFDSPIVKEGTLATVLGWGNTEQRYQKTDLRSVQVPISNIESCENNYYEQGYNISLNMLCAGYDEGGKDACTGDSGGPLLIPSVSGTGWDQLGIVSFGIGCGLPNFFGVYTRVSRYSQFIQSKICSDGIPKPVLEIKRNNNSVELSLNTDGDYQHYRLYYAPYETVTPIQYFEIHGSNSLSVDFAEAEKNKWHIIAQTIDGNCTSDFSNLSILQ